MHCANCATNGGVAYTLTTYVKDRPGERARGGTLLEDRTVELHFCSGQCLRAWT